MNEGIEKGGRGLTHASAGLVAQADEAEAHLLAGSPPLFVFPGSLMLGTGSWDSCALSADILGRVVFRGVTSSNVKLLSIFESSRNPSGLFDPFEER